MEKLCLFMLMLSLYFIGSDAGVKIKIPNPIHYGEPTVGSCVVSGLRYPLLKLIRVELEQGKEACKTTLSNKLDRDHPYYTRNFTITCSNNTRSVGIKCYAITLRNGIDRAQVDVIPKPPKIVNKPANVTSEVGLPVTLSCHVEGDPTHYWVGWMHKESIIEEGEQHAISTSPNFYGSSHYLTVHTVKVPGEYECKVFTMGGIVQDQTSHQINIDQGTEKAANSSSSLLSSLRTFLF